MRPRTSALLAAVVALLSFASAALVAQGRGGNAAASAPFDPKDLSGYWELPPDAHDGRNIPAATLAPTVTKQNRWIYLNRDKHIPVEEYEAGVNGDSIGRWEGNTLVVDTTMFHAENGILGIPGGGFRTPASQLVERFRLLKNGQVLQVVSTWSDAKVFRTPHMYELRYTRLPRDYEARPNAVCDPYDEERAQLFSGPPKLTP